MKLDYQLTSVPEDTSGYRLGAYTEGTLCWYLEEQLFLKADDILLVEMASTFQRWLTSPAERSIDLYYASMNYEEEPIVALRFDPQRQAYRAESIWASASTSWVEPNVARLAVQNFLERLGNDLLDGQGVDLAARL